MTNNYTVHAERAGRFWELHIYAAGVSVGVTQSRNLGSDADEMIRSYVALTTGDAAHSFTYDIIPKVGSGLDAEAAAARRAAQIAEEAVRAAAASNRAAAKHLRDAGLTGRDTAVVLGITPQRVSQLLSSGVGHPSEKTSKRGRSQGA